MKRQRIAKLSGIQVDESLKTKRDGSERDDEQKNEEQSEAGSA